MSRLYIEVHPVLAYIANQNREHKLRDTVLWDIISIKTIQHLLHSSLFFQLQAPELHVTEFKLMPLFTGQFNLNASGRMNYSTESKSQFQFSFITLLGQCPLNTMIKSNPFVFCFVCVFFFLSSSSPFKRHQSNNVWINFHLFWTYRLCVFVHQEGLCNFPSSTQQLTHPNLADNQKWIY